jgi:RNA polymerase sigma-70 factor (ECF subfamily)
VAAADSTEVARFRTLFESHWDAVARYARRRVDPSAVADVASEVFVVAWRRRDQIPADPLPWLYGVARRVVANQRRGAARADRLVDRLGQSLPADLDEVRRRADPAGTVPAALDFAAAFDRLPEADREVLALVGWEGLTGREVATALDCTLGAVTMRLSRARRRLRDLLAEPTVEPAAELTDAGPKEL